MSHLLIRLALALRSCLRREEGQTSAEYALVLLGAGAIAFLVFTWAGDTGKVGELLDVMFDKVIDIAG